MMLCSHPVHDGRGRAPASEQLRLLCKCQHAQHPHTVVKLTQGWRDNVGVHAQVSCQRWHCAAEVSECLPNEMMFANVTGFA